MSKLHYTELFYSIQGEGRYMGVPSVFLRMFGCNFRCKNFGRYEKDILGADETHNPEVVEFIKNIDQYKTFKDLPLAKTGCDSYSSIYPEFKQFVIKESSDAIADRILELLPNNEWGGAHLVITGGEPLLGWQKAYPDLLRLLKDQGLMDVTFETNGTQELGKELRLFINDENIYTESGIEFTFSVSPKLSVSGETTSDAIKPMTVYEYEKYGYTYLKFVVASEEDVDEALKMTELYRAVDLEGPVYLMPVGGVESVYALNNKRVAELAMKHGLRYSDRLQMLWKNEWGK